MTAANFPACLAATLAEEGGYVDNPKDPGGATNLGVTLATLRGYRRRDVTKAEVKALTVDDVRPIYRKNYWNALSGDQLPAGVDLASFDFGVNSGTSRAAKALQKAAGVKADGDIGPATIAAIGQMSSAVLTAAICDARLSFLHGLTNWKVFGKGWGARVGRIKAKALLMAGKSVAALQSEAAHEAQSARGDERKAAAATGGGVGTGAVATVSSTAFDWTTVAALGLAALMLAVCAIVLVRRAAARREASAAILSVAAGAT